MKFTIETKPLALALNAAVGFAQKASLFTPYSMVYLEAKNNLLTIRTGNSSSNYENTIAATIEEEGAVLATADKIEGIISKITAESVTIEREGANLRVKPSTGKKTSVKLACRDADTSIAPYSCADNLFVKIKGTETADAISHVVIAASKATDRPALMGIRFEQTITEDAVILDLVATNGKMLAKEAIALEHPIPGFTAATIPTQFALKMIPLLKAEDCSIAFDANRVFMKSGFVQINSSLIVSLYPDWRKVIPPSTWEKIEFTVNGTELADTLGLTSVLVDGASRKTHFTFDKNTVTVMSATDAFGEAEQEVDCTSENFPEDMDKFTLNFNEQLIQPVISMLKTSKVFMILRKNPDRPQNLLMGPLLVTSDVHTALMYCVMPMQG